MINETVEPVILSPKRGESIYTIKPYKHSLCKECKTAAPRYNRWGRVYCEVERADVPLRGTDAAVEFDVAAIVYWGLGEVSHDVYLLKLLPEKQGLFGRNSWLQVGVRFLERVVN